MKVKKQKTKRQPEARGSHYCGVWGGSNVSNLTLINGVFSTTRTHGKRLQVNNNRHGWEDNTEQKNGGKKSKVKADVYYSRSWIGSS